MKRSTILTTACSANVVDVAKRELGAFLFAVRDVFGEDMVERAADLWIRHLDQTEFINSDAERVFRQITIRTSTWLATSSARGGLPINNNFTEVPSQGQQSIVNGSRL